LPMLIASAPAAASRKTSAPVPAALPPALRALEAKLARVQLSSVKLSAALAAEGPGRKRSAVSRGPFGPFGKRARGAVSEAVFSELEHARSIVELPPRVLDEQPVTGFAASVPAGAGEGGSAPRSGRRRHRAAPLQRYEVFFAEDGVPLLVRESMPIHGRGIGF